MACCVLFSEASHLVRKTISVINEAVQSNKFKEGSFGFMTYVMSRKELQQKDVFILTLSLFADGLSTVSLLAFTIYIPLFSHHRV